MFYRNCRLAGLISGASGKKEGGVKMSEPTNKHISTPEIQAMEECGKLIQAIGRGIRFGWMSCPPDTYMTNVGQLTLAWRDVQNAMGVLLKGIGKNNS